MTVVQLYLSRIAAEAVDVDALKFRARDRGIAHWMVETSYYRTRGRCRVTMSGEVAELLIRELHDAIVGATTQQAREACARALNDLVAAIAEAGRPILRERSDAERGAAGNVKRGMS